MKTNNEIYIEKLITILKEKEDKENYLQEVITNLESQFLNNKIYSIKNKELDIISSDYVYETLNTQNKLNPEIFSLLDELLLSVKESRYETGSYYTNKDLVNTILKEKEIYQKTIFDPASGTGNFLINVILMVIDKLETKKDYLNYIKKYIYSNELVPFSTEIFIKRLSYISKFKYNESLTPKEIEMIKSNFWNKDFLINFNININFDIVIGNPPYLGTKSLGKEYLEKLKKEFGFTDDLYCMFTYKILDKYLGEKSFFSFVTSNTYLTLKTKKYLRELMLNRGLYKIIENDGSNFKIKTSTTTFFINKTKENKTLEIYKEQKKELIKIKDINIEELNKDKQISINKNNKDIENMFYKVKYIYDEYEKEIGTTKKLEKFKETNEYKELIKNNDYLPLGLISYIATGVDFKGNNDKILYSIENKKHNLIENKNDVQNILTENDFTKGLETKKYIKAIKGKEHLFVKWDKETFNYLKSIKAPLRNLTLYGGVDLLYCKTSTYEFTIVDKNTLCINTAGACFIKPLINIGVNNIEEQINKKEIKEYLKNNVNNSLCLTPNDLKLIPIKIK